MSIRRFYFALFFGLTLAISLSCQALEFTATIVASTNFSQTATIDYAVLIDDYIIPYSSYSKALKAAVKKMQLIQNKNFESTDNQALLLITKRDLLNDLINQYFMQRGAKKFKVQVTDKEIDTQLKNIIRSGYPSEKEFLADITAEGISRAEIVANIRTQLMKEKITHKLLENITVSKGEIADYLAQIPEQGKGMEKRLVSHIVVNDKEKAQMIRKRYLAGESFASLAAKFSIDAETVESGGNLGYIDLAMLPEKAQKEVSRLKKGDISKIIEIDNEYYLFQLGDILELGPRKLEALRLHLLQEKQEEFFDRWLERQKKQSQITLNPELRAIYYQKLDKESLPTLNAVPTPSALP